MHDNRYNQRAGAGVCVNFFVEFQNLFIMWLTIFKNDFANSFAESWIKNKFQSNESGNKIFVWLDGIVGREQDLADRIWSLVFLNENSDFENRWHEITTGIIYACPWM